MAFKSPDRTHETCTGAGTGALALAGSPPTNFRTLATSLSDGDTFPGVVVHRTAAEWQSGTWRFASAGAGSITLIGFHASSTGSQVSFSAGVKDIIVGPVGRPESWIQRSANFAVLPRDRNDCDTTAGAFTATLPASPADGDRAYFNDPLGTWPTNNLTIDGNGKTISANGVVGDRRVCDISGQFCLAFHSNVWRVR